MRQRVNFSAIMQMVGVGHDFWVMSGVVPSLEQSSSRILPMKTVLRYCHTSSYDLKPLKHLQLAAIIQSKLITKKPQLLLSFFTQYCPMQHTRMQDDKCFNVGQMVSGMVHKTASRSRIFS